MHATRVIAGEASRRDAAVDMRMSEQALAYGKNFQNGTLQKLESISKSVQKLLQSLTAAMREERAGSFSVDAVYQSFAATDFVSV
jgi:hypothetical protein